MYRLPYQGPTSELESIVLVAETHESLYIGHYPIGTRACTLQEEMLSTRSVLFGHEVVHYL